MLKTILNLCALCLLLGACSSRPKAGNEPAGEERPLLTVTIEPLRYFTEALAGDRFRVNSLVPRGASPETYDPTPRQLVDLSESAAYLSTGFLGFEQTWTDRLSANAPHLRIFDLSHGIDLIYDETHAHDDGTHPHPDGVEPHIWTSARNARIIIDNITKALIELDAAGDSVYRHRCDSLERAVARTDSLCRTLLQRPGADRAFLIYHPALSYFARDYGLRQIPIENGGKEPTPAWLKTLMDRCRREGVRIVFVQPEFDRRNAELIAGQTGAKVVEVNPLAYDWQAEMLHVAQTLAGKE